MLTKWELEQVQKKYDAIVTKWAAGHPELIHCNSNSATMERFMKDNEVTFNEQGLEYAYQALVASDSLVLDRSKIYDPDKPELRADVWKNGVFTPYDAGNSRGTQRTAIVGQHLPGTSVGDDAIIKKDHRRMTSAEYAEAIRTSKVFRDKMNRS